MNGEGPRPSGTSQATGRTAKPVKSDASWFSPRTRRDPGFIPECAACPEDAWGGELLSSLPGATLGKARWLVRFTCRQHGPAVPGILVSNLFQYRVLGRRSEGVYALEKLNEAEQSHRAALRDKQNGRSGLP